MLTAGGLLQEATPQVGQDANCATRFGRRTGRESHSSSPSRRSHSMLEPMRIVTRPFPRSRPRRSWRLLLLAGWLAVGLPGHGLPGQTPAGISRARADYLEALTLAEEGSRPEALGLLAESLRLQPENNPAAPLTFELLTEGRTNSRFVLRGHRGTVLYAAYSPDGSKIVTASEDHTARLWDARTGQQSARRSNTATTCAWPSSARTARGWSPPPTTTPRASGTWGRASRSANPCGAATTRSALRASARTASSSARGRRKAPCASGTRRRANRSARPRCPAATFSP